VNVDRCIIHRIFSTYLEVSGDVSSALTGPNFISRSCRRAGAVLDLTHLAGKAIKASKPRVSCQFT